jgi:hypothetical protein
MHANRLLLIFLPALTGLFGMPALGDVTLRIADDKGAESLIYVNGGRCRIETQGMPVYTVIDLRDHSLAYVDTGKREYSTLTETQLRRQLDQMDGIRQSLGPHMETLRDGLRTLPAEQRALFEQFMAGKAPPGAGNTTTLVPDGGMQRFGGLACAHHRLMQGQRQVGDACLLQRAGGVVSRGDFSTLSMTMDLLRDLSGRVGGLLELAGNKTALLQAQAKGIPVALRDYSSGETYRVVQASAARLDESLFSGHRAYRRVDAPALPGLF